MNFVLFHIGDTILPDLLAKSIRKFSPNSLIYFVTDNATKKIDDADHCVTINGDPQKIMTFRLKAYSEIKLKEHAIYLDTDMLMLKSYNFKEFEKFDIALCSREFGNDAKINENYKNQNWSNYSGKSAGEVFPYVACFSITKDYLFWKDCYNELLKLDEKFHYWYGDQEVMRLLLETKNYHFSKIKEGTMCPPLEYLKEDSIFAHFKGGRKNQMEEAAKFILSNKY